MWTRDDLLEAVARRMWDSDREADPMFHVSYESSKRDYRRRAEVAAEVLWMVTA